MVGVNIETIFCLESLEMCLFDLFDLDDRLHPVHTGLYTVGPYKPLLLRSNPSQTVVVCLCGTATQQTALLQQSSAKKGCCSLAQRSTL